VLETRPTTGAKVVAKRSFATTALPVDEQTTDADAAMRVMTVTGLHTYPIKSCAAVDLMEARVTPRGLELDRDFMVVDDENDFVSQRKVPELALVVPTIAVGSISLTAPGMEAALVPLDRDADVGEPVTATVHGRSVAGRVVAEDLNEWFTTFLASHKSNRRFRLLRVCDDIPGHVKDRYKRHGASNQVGFADGSAILLATEPSLAQLNAQLEEPVPMERFRPNIGALEAFAVKACDRCVITDTDQRTAAVGKAVRMALRTRRGVNAHDHSNKGVFFAQNLNHVYAPGTVIRVGDAVRVIARSSKPNVVLATRGLKAL
jgi:uncharacterized protein YcbX